MNELRLDTSNAVSDDALEKIRPSIEKANDTLLNRNGKGSEFLGWLDLPDVPNKEEYTRIKSLAQKVQADSDVLVVIGIGGSYLGTKAAFEFLKHRFYNQLDKSTRKYPELYFAGINISADYINDLMDVIGDRDFSINMISKSGTTTEPAIAFRILKQKLIDKYGEASASKRIYATTDANKGALKSLATKKGYECFVVPDNVGGRFSVLTAVGLFPLAVIGADIDMMIEGSKKAAADSLKSYDKNPVLKYAAARNILYQNGKKIELLINYDPRLQYLSEWWKQLYGESEGKGNQGIFPASANFTADLHSMGQYIQDGERHLFETAILINSSNRQIKLGTIDDNPDGLNYLSGKSLDYINRKAAEGTLAAHLEGDVPNIIIELDKANEFSLGYLFYFFEKACAISGYVLGVNPFDQPGVEAYKKNMFELLGKPAK